MNLEQHVQSQHRLCLRRTILARPHQRRSYEKPLGSPDKQLIEMRRHQGPTQMLAKLYLRMHLHLPDAAVHHLLAGRALEITVLKAVAVAAELVMELVMKIDVIPA